MRTKQIIACLLLIILLLGCKTSTTGKGKTYTGKDGIILSFAGAMPTTFYTESDIPIRGRAPVVGAAIGIYSETQITEQNSSRLWHIAKDNSAQNLVSFAIGPQDGVMGTPTDDKREGDEIRVSAKVTNKGTSFVRGAVYIVGYDPSIISFEGQDDVHTLGQTYRDCTMGIDKLGFGLASGKFQCQEIDLGVLGKVDLGIAVNRQGQVSADIRNLNLGAALDKLFGTDLFEKSKLLGNSDISFSKNDAGTRFDIGFSNPDMDVEYASRGRLFQTLFSFIDFQIGGRGVEYIMPPSVTEYPGVHTQYVDFKGHVKGLPAGQEAADQTLLVKTCYLYSTFVSPEICIDADPSAATKKVCRPTRYGGGSGQGAPVVVSSIQQETTPTRVYLKIDIENAGKGQLYDPQKVQRCNPYYPLPADENDLDTVLIGAAYIGKQRLKCDPPMSVRLYKNKGRFTCYYDLKDAFATKSAYLTPLTLELWYGYSTSIKKDIKIKKVG